MSYACESEGVTEAKTPGLLDQVWRVLRLKHIETVYVAWVRGVTANLRRQRVAI